LLTKTTNPVVVVLIVFGTVRVPQFEQILFRVGGFHIDGKRVDAFEPVLLGPHAWLQSLVAHGVKQIGPVLRGGTAGARLAGLPGKLGNGLFQRPNALVRNELGLLLLLLLLLRAIVVIIVSQQGHSFPTVVQVALPNEPQAQILIRVVAVHWNVDMSVLLVVVLQPLQHALPLVLAHVPLKVDRFQLLQAFGRQRGRRAREVLAVRAALVHAPVSQLLQRLVVIVVVTTSSSIVTIIICRLRLRDIGVTVLLVKFHQLLVAHLPGVPTRRVVLPQQTQFLQEPPSLGRQLLEGAPLVAHPHDQSPTVIRRSHAAVPVLPVECHQFLVAPLPGGLPHFPHKIAGGQLRELRVCQGRVLVRLWFIVLIVVQHLVPVPTPHSPRPLVQTGIIVVRRRIGRDLGVSVRGVKGLQLLDAVVPAATAQWLFSGIVVIIWL